MGGKNMRALWATFHSWVKSGDSANFETQQVTQANLGKLGMGRRCHPRGKGAQKMGVQMFASFPWN